MQPTADEEYPEALASYSAPSALDVDPLAPPRLPALLTMQHPLLDRASRRPVAS